MSIPRWWSGGPVPVTLARAREFVRPGPEVSASRDEWISYYEYCARVFSAVSRIDVKHKFEATAEAGIAQDWAEKLRDNREQVEPVAYYIP
ncbi:AMED_5909 family protein [Actinokineospora sp. NBRC 105648]|uniref:AMED_5909 family protein n=1 Tax=Actinokineospora sp. NBRC 105648 TaxID=3032206 RepID=UPI002556771C|nr:AMED_5909 family protein [Actinokineospora sp. NBRC 105648]